MGLLAGYRARHLHRIGGYRDLALFCGICSMNVMAERIVSSQEIDKALEFLRDSAFQIGKVVERYTKAEKMLGHIEALLFEASDQKSAEARKAEARTDPRYVAAINELAVSAGEKAKLYALREAASMKIEAWRTESSTLRSFKP